MGIVVDTSALLQIDRARADWRPLLAPHLDEPVLLPSIVWAELLIGVRLAKSSRIALTRQRLLDQFRQNIPMVDFTADIAECYADIFAECSEAGISLPANDLAVAATARFYQYAVLISSRDEKHFRSVPKLMVITLGIS